MRIVVPAAVDDFQVRPQWTVEFIKATVPAKRCRSQETECREKFQKQISDRRFARAKVFI